MNASRHVWSARHTRPFPYQLTIGNDIVKVNRVKRLLFVDKDDTTQAKFLRKLFTQAELKHLETRFPEISSTRINSAQVHSISQHIAGRYVLTIAG